MKKLISLLLSAAFLLAVCLTGCTVEEQSERDGALSIISTVFPGYDFARQICGEGAEIKILIPPGSESHSYEPTPKDIISIQNCDLFIYVGGESDAWVDQILQSMPEPVNTLKMMDCVTAVEEELREGMQSAEDDHDGDEAGREAHEYDEHVWTSPVNAVKILNAIGRQIEALDRENQSTYRTNCAAYAGRLESLDAEFRSFFETVTNKTLLFGDRFPLRYFTEEYGLDYYAAFPGCSSESEPSAKTIAFLSDKVKAEGISTVFYIEFSNHLVADSIAESTGAETAQFHSCHNVSPEELENGVSYESLMRKNLEVLKEAMH